MALLTPQVMPVTGLNATYTAVTSSDTAAPRPDTFLHIKNDDVAATTVTVVVPGTEFGQANPDVAVSVPAAGERFIWLERPNDLADPTTKLITVTYSNTTSVTAALITLVA